MIIPLLLLSVLFLFIGFFTYNEFIATVLPEAYDLLYMTGHVEHLLEKRLLYSISIGMLPFMFHLLWKFSPIVSSVRKVISVFIVLCMGTLFLWVKHNELVKEVQELSDAVGMTSVLGLESLEFELYLLWGLLTGATISFLLLGQNITGNSPSGSGNKMKKVYKIILLPIVLIITGITLDMQFLLTSGVLVLLSLVVLGVWFGEEKF